MLAAGALLFGSLIVACSPHGTGIIDDPTPTPKPTPASEEEDNGKPVDGSWDFTGTDTYSIGTNDAIVTDKALANPTAKGATLSVKGNLKWGNGTDDASSYSFWFKKASAYEEGKAASKASGYLALTTDSKATLTIVYDAGGDNDGEKRWIAVCDSSDKPVSDAALISNLIEKNVYKTLKLSGLKKGSYKIYVSGTRIRSLQITNQAFESKTKEITNDAETLGLVATATRNSDETIATGEVRDGKVVITSKKEGTAKVYAGTSLTEYATINVTVSSTGAITTSIIKYVAFTAATNDATANDVATLGLVGASATSSESEYVTAEISEGKIVIKSVKAPGDSAKSITITVTDANSKTATIAVTEARDGSLTLGNITKYAVPKPVNGTDFEVSADKKLTAKKDNMEYKASSATEYTALTNGTPTEALAEGSYLIRFKAVANAYAESEATSFTISNGGSVYSAISLSSSDLTATTYTETSTIKTNMEIIASTNKAVTVDASNKSVDGQSYSLRIKLGGAGSTTMRCIHCSNVAAGTYKVAWMSGTSGNSREIIISDGTNQIATANNDGTALASTEFTVQTAGSDIYFYSTTAINIYGIYQ